MVFEALLAPIAFTLIMVVLIGWALVRRARRRRGAGPSDARVQGKEGESSSADDAQRRRYGS